MSGDGTQSDDAASRSLTSSEVARRILARDAPGLGSGSVTPEMTILALQRSWTRVIDALRNSMGDVGYAALLARGVARTEGAHPVLNDLRSSTDEGIRLDGIAASAAAHGIERVAAAIEALIAALVDILARLIGDDMTIRLLDPDGPQPAPPGGAREP